MKDENVAAGCAVGLEGGRGGGEGVGRQEGGQELLVLAVLEVLRAPDVPAVEFELVASVNYPGTFLVGYLCQNQCWGSVTFWGRSGSGSGSRIRTSD